MITFAACRVAVACAEPNLPAEEPVVPPPDRSTDSGKEPVKPIVDASSPPPDRAEPVDAAADVDAGRMLRVFVTSTATMGNLGGVTGADTKCTTLATAAGLGGSWTAWLSNQGGPHAIDRVTSVGPWHLRTGELVAASKADLLAGPLKHAIDRDENGVPAAPSRVWTGTGPDGRFLTNECDKWTGSGGGNIGRFGETNATNATWTTSGTELCVESRRVYCFEL